MHPKVIILQGIATTIQVINQIHNHSYTHLPFTVPSGFVSGNSPITVSVSSSTSITISTSIAIGVRLGSTGGNLYPANSGQVRPGSSLNCFVILSFTQSAQNCFTSSPSLNSASSPIHPATPPVGIRAIRAEWRTSSSRSDQKRPFTVFCDIIENILFRCFLKSFVPGNPLPIFRRPA